jgi:hypothetical protein
MEDRAAAARLGAGGRRKVEREYTLQVQGPSRRRRLAGGSAHDTGTGDRSMTTAGSEDVSLDEVMALFRRHWRLMVQIGLGGSGRGGYVRAGASSHLAGHGQLHAAGRPAGASGLVGLAAQFGVQVPQANPANSPVFYMQLLQSREILQSAVASTYEVADADSMRKASLIDLFEVRGKTPELRTALAVEALQKRIGVMISRETVW